jgi:hypothetical protein
MGARVSVACAAALLAGCIVQEHNTPPPPPETAIDFSETINLGYACGGPLTSWTVTNRTTSDQGTAGCEQPVLFPHLEPGQNYDFDVVAYDGSRVCWQGSCSVYAAYQPVNEADCSAQIAHLCGN